MEQVKKFRKPTSKRKLSFPSYRRGGDIFRYQPAITTATNHPRDEEQRIIEGGGRRKEWSSLGKGERVEGRRRGVSWECKPRLLTIFTRGPRPERTEYDA